MSSGSGISITVTGLEGREVSPAIDFSIITESEVAIVIKYPIF